MSRISHILDHSLPEQSGYASRSHSILVALARAGLSVEAVTGPKHERNESVQDCIDEIKYTRTTLPESTAVHGVTGQLRTVSAMRNSIRTLIAERDIGLLHAHSPCLNGLASMGLGVPVLYEMRSSWEDAAVAVGITTAGSIRYRLSRQLETFVARRANAIVVICHGLKRDLEQRGIQPDKISVVPNALPESLFDLPSQESIDSVRQEHALQGAFVVGFFGSFFDWEGVGSLIRSFPQVLSAISSARLLLAGSGRQDDMLRTLTHELGLDSQVIFAGRVSADQIPSYYGVADVMAFPRVSDRLTEMVTPLKPLESMAQETLVVASDVGGHKELIRHRETGFLFPAGNDGALAGALIEAHNARDANRNIIEAAKSWVDCERRWSVICRRYIPIYENLLGTTLS